MYILCPTEKKSAREGALSLVDYKTHRHTHFIPILAYNFVFCVLVFANARQLAFCNFDWILLCLPRITNIYYFWIIIEHFQYGTIL